MAFPETNWSILATASLHGDDGALEALNTLCRNYWQPVFLAIRSRGYNEEDARDHTQGFFKHLMEKSILGKADQGQGRFRTFLLTVLWRFLNDDKKMRTADKRWGYQQRESIEVAETETAREDEAFVSILDQEWAANVIQRTLDFLAEDCINKQGEEAWLLLKRFLPGSRGIPPVEELAHFLGISESGARSEIHRLRNRFREHLRRQVMATVTSMDELDDEIRYLGQVLRTMVPASPTISEKK